MVFSCFLPDIPALHDKIHRIDGLSTKYPMLALIGLINMQGSTVYGMYEYVGEYSPSPASYWICVDYISENKQEKGGVGIANLIIVALL